MPGYQPLSLSLSPFPSLSPSPPSLFTFTVRFHLLEKLLAPHTIRVNHSVPHASWPLCYGELAQKGEELEGKDGSYPPLLPNALPDLWWGPSIC